MKNVEVESATTRFEQLTPEFKEIKERILVKTGHTKWVRERVGGDCYSIDPRNCTVWKLIEIPDQFEEVTRLVNMGCDGSGIPNSGCIREVTVPAKMETKKQQVVRHEASATPQTLPAEYQTISKKIIKTPATIREVVVPAVYKSITKRIVKTPAKVIEEIIPAEYETVEVEIVVTPATTREEIIPAKYKTVTRQIVKVPASTQEEIIPAEYELVTRKILVSPEQTETVEVPEEFETVTKEMLVKKGEGLQTKRIVCPQHQPWDLTRKLQLALRTNGFDPGPIDNIFGPLTYGAMVRFQKANNMWQGQLDYATVEALDLELNPEAYFDVEEAAIANADLSQEATDELFNKGEEAPTSSVTENTPNNTTEEAAIANTAADENISTTSMSGLELEMIDEINLMRSNPKGYATLVKVYIQEVQADPSLDDLFKKEETETALELIGELEAMEPLPIFEPHEGLHQVAIQHGKDVQQQGAIGHVGSDGSFPWDRIRRDTELSDGNENLVAGGNTVRESVMILLVDSGIPGRGHRRTLFNKKWEYCGIAFIGNVGEYSNAWIQVFGKK